MNLTDAVLGKEYIIQRIETDDEELNAFLFSLGCYSGEPITVVSRRRDSALTEGLAVGALIHSRILLVGAHQNAVQRAVVCGVAMVCAGLDGAFDALVCVFVHGSYLLFWILL